MTITVNRDDARHRRQGAGARRRREPGARARSTRLTTYDPTTQHGVAAHRRLDRDPAHRARSPTRSSARSPGATPASPGLAGVSIDQNGQVHVRPLQVPRRVQRRPRGRRRKLFAQGGTSTNADVSSSRPATARSAGRTTSTSRRPRRRRPRPASPARGRPASLPTVKVRVGTTEVSYAVKAATRRPTSPTGLNAAFANAGLALQATDTGTGVQIATNDYGRTPSFDVAWDGSGYVDARRQRRAGHDRRRRRDRQRPAAARAVQRQPDRRPRAQDHGRRRPATSAPSRTRRARAARADRGRRGDRPRSSGTSRRRRTTSSRGSSSSTTRSRRWSCRSRSTRRCCARSWPTLESDDLDAEVAGQRSRRARSARASTAASSADDRRSRERIPDEPARCCARQYVSDSVDDDVAGPHDRRALRPAAARPRPRAAGDRRRRRRATAHDCLAARAGDRRRAARLARRRAVAGGAQPRRHLRVRAAASSSPRTSRRTRRASRRAASSLAPLRDAWQRGRRASCRAHATPDGAA